MQKRKAETVDIGAIPEVVNFVDAQEALKEFREEHADVFAQLDQLVDRYNTSLEQAEKVCRAKAVSCGPFNLYQFTTKYDAEALYNAVGRDRFLELGGKIETITKYEVDRGKLEASIAQNKLDTGVVDRVRKETANFHKPDKVNLP